MLLHYAIFFQHGLFTIETEHGNQFLNLSQRQNILSTQLPLHLTLHRMAAINARPHLTLSHRLKFHLNHCYFTLQMNGTAKIYTHSRHDFLCIHSSESFSELLKKSKMNTYWPCKKLHYIGHAVIKEKF